MVEVDLQNHPEVANKKLEELQIHKQHKGVVMSVRSMNGEHHFNPPSDKVLCKDDSLLILAPNDFDRTAKLV